MAGTRQPQGGRGARQGARRLQRQDGVEGDGGVEDAAEQQPVVVDGLVLGRGPGLGREGLDAGEDDRRGVGGFRGGLVRAKVVDED
jgi:hypothetical protein